MMRKIAVLMALLLALCLSGCGAQAADGSDKQVKQVVPDKQEKQTEAGAALTLADFAAPPQPQISYGGQQISPVRGNHDWGQPQENGLTSRYIACGMHMLDYMEQYPAEMPRLTKLRQGEELDLLSLTRVMTCPFGTDMLLGELPMLEVAGASENAEERIALNWELPPDSLTVRLYDFEQWADRTCGNTEPGEVLLAEFIPADMESLPLPATGGLYVLEARWGDEYDLAGGQAEYGFYVNRWPLDFDNNSMIEQADWQLAQAAGICSREEFAAALRREYGQADPAEAERLLAGDIAVMCGVFSQPPGAELLK